MSLCTSLLWGPHESGQDIKIEGLILSQVNEIKYLSYIVVNNKSLVSELDTRTSNAFDAFVGLKKQIWLNKESSINTKCAVYCTTVLWTILYGAERWNNSQSASSCRIHCLHLCRVVIPPSMSVLDMTIKIWWCGSIDAGALGNAEHPFIAIAIRSTLGRNGGTW